MRKVDYYGDVIPLSIHWSITNLNTRTKGQVTFKALHTIGTLTLSHYQQPTKHTLVHPL